MALARDRCLKRLHVVGGGLRVGHQCDGAVPTVCCRACAAFDLFRGVRPRLPKVRMQVNQCWQEGNRWVARAWVRSRRPAGECRRFAIAPGHRCDLARNDADRGNTGEPSDGINNPVVGKVHSQ